MNTNYKCYKRINKTREVLAEEKHVKISTYLFQFSVYGGFLCWISTIISIVTMLLIEYYYCIAWTEGVAAQRKSLAQPGSPVWGPVPSNILVMQPLQIVILRCLRFSETGFGLLEKEGTFGKVWVRTR